MATEFKLPELGENVTEGDITRILVKVGDVVAQDQSVLEIETGKATIEVPCSVAGTVTAIQVKEGTKAKVGQVVLTLDASAEAPAPKKAKTADRKAEAPKAAAAPAAAPAPAPEPVPRPAAAATPPPAPPVPPVAGSFAASVAASPSVRMLAREVGIDIAEVAGSGPGGRISDDDVKAHSRALHAGALRSASSRPATPPLPEFARWGEVEREPLANIRLATAEHMGNAWSAVPHVTLHDLADITEIEKLRQDYRQRAEATGAKLTLTAFLIRILASALKVHPRFNTSLDMAARQLIYKRYVNVGIAVDTDRGLLVPVIRDVDKRNVVQIAQELGRISDRAKARKISPDEMQGGSITLTNIGGIGGKYFTSIVNWPEVAILGVGRASLEPVSINGFFQPRPLLPLSLSFDHRVIDGADGARFLRWIIDAIQNPALLTLEG